MFEPNCVRERKTGNSCIFQALNHVMMRSTIFPAFNCLCASTINLSNLPIPKANSLKFDIFILDVCTSPMFQSYIFILVHTCYIVITRFKTFPFNATFSQFLAPCHVWNQSFSHQLPKLRSPSRWWSKGLPYDTTPRVSRWSEESVTTSGRVSAAFPPIGSVCVFLFAAWLFFGSMSVIHQEVEGWWRNCIFEGHPVEGEICKYIRPAIWMTFNCAGTMRCEDWTVQKQKKTKSELLSKERKLWRSMSIQNHRKWTVLCSELQVANDNALNWCGLKKKSADKKQR